jgi:hypothetical protein
VPRNAKLQLKQKKSDFLQFLIIKPWTRIWIQTWIRIRIDLKRWIRIRIETPVRIHLLGDFLKSISFSCVQEVLEKANQMFNLNPRLGESLLEISERIQQDNPDKQLSAQLSTSAVSTPTAVSTPAAAAPELPKALRGLNPKLLEKIRRVFVVVLRLSSGSPSNKPNMLIRTLNLNLCVTMVDFDNFFRLARIKPVCQSLDCIKPKQDLKSGSGFTMSIV